MWKLVVGGSTAPVEEALAAVVAGFESIAE